MRWTEHEVGVPLADQPGERAAVFQRRLQLAVVIVEDDALDAEHLVGLLDFGLAADGERAARLAPVADVAVGHGDEEHVMPELGPARGRAAGLNLAVVGMRAERDDAELAIGGRHLDARNVGAGRRNN